MAAPKSSLNSQADSSTPYQLDPSQTLRAANALLKKIKADEATRRASATKADLLADEDDADAEREETPLWLNLTTKKHITDKKRMKPGKIALPHPLQDASSPTLRVCLITADPQRKYKDLVENESFPTELRGKIARVIGLEKLKAKYKSYESKRQLFSEYDLFLADDRIIIYLPTTLGSIFYATGAKRPVPVVLMGRKEEKDDKGEKRIPLAQGGTKAVRQEPSPPHVAKELERAIGSALIHLSPGTNAAVKVGHTGMEAKQVQENVEAVVNGLVTRYIVKGWRNVRGIHIKGSRTAALPIWMADELWEDEADVLEKAPEVKAVTGGKAKKDKKRKRGALTEGVANVPDDEIALKKRTDGEPEKPKKKRKSSEGVVDVAAAEKAARKEALKRQKEEARSSLSSTSKGVAVA